MPQLQCEEIRFPSADGVHTVAASMYTMPYPVSLCGLSFSSATACASMYSATAPWRSGMPSAA